MEISKNLVCRSFYWNKIKITLSYKGNSGPKKKLYKRLIKWTRSSASSVDNFLTGYYTPVKGYEFDLFLKTYSSCCMFIQEMLRPSSVWLVTQLIFHLFLQASNTSRYSSFSFIGDGITKNCDESDWIS